MARNIRGLNSPSLFESNNGYSHIGTHDSEDISQQYVTQSGTDYMSDDLGRNANVYSESSPGYDVPYRDSHGIANGIRNRSLKQSLEIVQPESNFWHRDSNARTISRKPVASSSTYELIDRSNLMKTRNVVADQYDRRSLWKIWWFEIVCCLLAVCSLLAMIITIRVYDGQPLPRWPYDVGIGSLLAIYGVIFRSAIGFVLSEGLGQLKWTLFKSPRPLHDLYVYDESTRGPLGCIQLLSSFRGFRIVARVGALATLGLLIVDPFTQQLVGFKECDIIQPSAKANATIPRTQAYFGHGNHSYWGYAIPDFSMQAAFQASVFAQDGIKLTPTCPTGNCTFSDAFNTVGYCHTCVDLTSTLVVQQNTSLIDMYSNGSLIKNRTETLVTLPKAQIPYSPAVELSVSSRQPYSLVSSTSSNGTERPVFYGTFLVPGSDMNDRYGDSYGARAHQCILDICVRTTSSKVISGALEEKTLATYNTWGPHWMPTNLTRSMLDLSCLDAAQRQYLSDVGYRFSSTDKFIPYNGSVHENGTVSAGNVNWGPRAELPPPEEIEKALATIPSKCIYTTSWEFHKGLMAWLAEIMAGRVPSLMMEVNDTISPILFNLVSTGYDFDSFDRSFLRMADGMTNYLRQSSVQNLSEPAYGDVYISTTCLRPKWQWIAYNGLITLMAVGFLIAMILETGVGQDKWRHDFKASALPLICAGLDGETRSHLLAALQSGKKSNLDRAALEMPVQFVWRDAKFTHPTS